MEIPFQIIKTSTLGILLKLKKNYTRMQRRIRITSSLRRNLKIVWNQLTCRWILYPIRMKLRNHCWRFNRKEVNLARKFSAASLWDPWDLIIFHQTDMNFFPDLRPQKELYNQRCLIFRNPRKGKGIYKACAASLHIYQLVVKFPYLLITRIALQLP